MLETAGEGLPPAFVSTLRRALSHYGVESLDRSPELEESLLWIYKSHQRVEQKIVPVMGVWNGACGTFRALLRTRRNHCGRFSTRS